MERESLNFTGMEAKSMISNRNIKEEDKGTFIWMRKMERSFRRAGSIEFELSHLSLDLTSSDLHIQVLPPTAMLRISRSLDQLKADLLSPVGT